MRLRSVLVDLAIAVAAFALTSFVIAAGGPVPDELREPDAGAYVLAGLYCASVVARRRSPEAAVVAGMAAGLAYSAAQYPRALMPVALLSLYTAGAQLRPRRARVILACALILGTLGTTLAPGPTETSVPVLILATWLFGRSVGSRRAYTEELEQKNRLLEQARVDLADQAVTEERLRIARELHDAVAHTMSVVAMHAGTGRMVAEDNPAAARRALATIETAARSALFEMRRLLGVLRSADGRGPDRLAPAPGLGDLDALVADVVTSGVTVEVRVDGERPDVPAGVDLSAYRIVQEALTNVIKHAGRGRATVTVRYEDDAVVVEVDDDGTGGRMSPSMPSAGGHGLAGMRERVAIFHGELEAGPRADGGFRVVARLPFEDGS